MTIQILPMRADQFEDYRKVLIPDYAQENVAAGYWHADEALELSRKSLDGLLPQGLATPDHYFYKLVDGDQPVGHVWIKANQDTLIKSLYIFDIVVDEEFRGKGYGRQAMRLIEERARELGLSQVGLHVFSHNAVARQLYESQGYAIKSLNMFKSLE